jgi:competence protein ComK
MKTTSEYIITVDTVMLAPAFEVEGGTIVHEKEQILYVKQSPWEIINENCFLGFSSYDGRVKAAKKYLNCDKKVPVLIYEREQIAAFPTRSPTHHLCHWVFPLHARAFIKEPGEKNIVILQTRHGEKVRLPVSHYIALKQMHRTYHLLHTLDTSS